VRIAVVGNVDAGKSTLLGVLTHNILDDGRGNARRKLFRLEFYLKKCNKQFEIKGINMNSSRGAHPLLATISLDFQ
jgi:GTPase